MTPVSLGPPSGQLVLSGLNWQFQFAPVTSLMISGLPAPAPAPALPPLLALLPQPAATSPAAESAAASAMGLLRLTTVVLPEHGGWGPQRPGWPGRLRRGRRGTAASGRLPACCQHGGDRFGGSQVR